MNEHVPDSSGLPLRAMVMVLLFLGVIFLLVGFQAMGSGGHSDGDAPVATAPATSAPTTTSTVAPAKPEVRVFNISERDGLAGQTADQLRAAHWDVVEVENLVLPDVATTTVYFTTAPGERDAAHEVGKLLDAAVEPRLPEIADLPPGIIVVVAG